MFSRDKYMELLFRLKVKELKIKSPNYRTGETWLDGNSVKDLEDFADLDLSLRCWPKALSREQITLGYCYGLNAVSPQNSYVEN